MPAEGLDVAPERGDLEGHAVGDDRDRAVVDPGRHGLQPGPFGERHHLLRLGGGGKIDLGDGKPEQRVAHGAADGARLDAVAIQRVEHGTRLPAASATLRRQAMEPRSGAQYPARSFEFAAAQSIVPGLMTPSSKLGG